MAFKGHIPWDKGLTSGTDVRVAKAGESRKGIKLSEEWKKNISLANMGKPSKLKGKKRPPFSAEWCKNLSLGHKGLPVWNKGIGIAPTSNERRMIKTYGLTLAEYDSMLLKQNGVCAICGKVNKSGFRLHVDHDHRINKVRGLLCKPCNRALGFFYDSVDTVFNAYMYLKTAD